MTIQKYLEKYPEKTLHDVPIKKKLTNGVLKARGCFPQRIDVKKEKKVSKQEIQAMKAFQDTESMLYELFRYSFQYSMDRIPRPITNAATSAEGVMVKLLETDISEFNRRVNFITPHQTLKLREMMNLSYEEELKRDIKGFVDAKSFVLPPCWNSIVGLRGIAIKCNTFADVK